MEGYSVTIIEKAQYEVSLDANDAEEAIEGARRTIEEMHQNEYGVLTKVGYSNVVEVIRIGDGGIHE